jgi:tetraacyldisaccharide 4'-kinase
MTDHKTPDFWYDTQSQKSRAIAMSLGSLSALYTIGHLIHQGLTKTHNAAIPVLCIGNLVSGGGGKTPTAIALMALLREQDLAKNPCFLSRGYGGKLSGPVLVDPAIHTAQDVGDEPLLLTKIAPTIIAADRVAGAKHAAALLHDFIIMDDGLQNPSLKKDLSIIVIDGATGFGNEMLLPAGPLRTPIHRGMKKADAVLLIGDDAANALRHVPAGKPVLHATLQPTALINPAPAYYAFCGLAHPAKFQRSLQESGLNVAGFTAYPDHHPYSESDLNNLKNKAESLNARLITTAKDAVKIPPGFLAPESFDILNVALHFADGTASRFQQLIESIRHA